MTSREDFRGSAKPPLLGRAPRTSESRWINGLPCGTRGRAVALTPAVQTLAIAILAAAMPAVPVAAPNGFSVAAETRNFTFYTRDGGKVDAQKNQSFLDDTSRRLGVTLAGKRAYYRYAWSEELAFVVGSAAASASGAYLASGDIHSTKGFDAHEIVHRVAFELGNPGSFFHEGLAVELGDGGRYGKAKVDEIARRLVGRVGFRTLVERFASLPPDVRYPLAGSFVRFLIARHGLAKVSEFFSKCGDERVRDAQFAKAMGHSLDDAGREWMATLGGLGR